MHKFITFIIILSLNCSAWALELEEALTHAYYNNEDLKSNRNNFLKEIEKFPQAFSSFMPNAAINIESSHTKSKYDSRYAPGAPEKNMRQVNRGLSIEQPIFNGGGSVAALKAAQSAFRASRAKYYDQEQRIIISLIKAYLNCYETKEKYEISASSVKTNKQQLEVAQEKMKLGEATEIDIATARAGLSQAETNKLGEYAKLQAANATFVSLFGVQPENITMPDLPKNLLRNVEELVQKSLRSNPNIDSVRHSVQAQKAQEMVAKARLLPSVDFKIRTGKVFYNPESRDNNLINNKSTTSIVSVNIPIYTKGGVEYSNIRIAKKQTRDAAITLDATIKKIQADSISSWESFEAAKSKITATTYGIEAAQIAYDGIMQEEIVGSKTMLDVLTAEEKLYTAKRARIEALKESVLSAYEMKALVGELTAHSLKLKVSYFIPEEEFKKIKKKLIIGF